jgi:hypothetical protein
MPRSSRATAPAGLTAVPDPRKRLSDGVLVEACIRARLVGIPLLKVEATIALAPAGLTAPTSAPRDQPIRSSARPSRAASTRSGDSREGLAEAVRTINEGAELLAQARRNGSSALRLTPSPGDLATLATESGGFVRRGVKPHRSHAEPRRR